jgi:hypothetical protein
VPEIAPKELSVKPGGIPFEEKLYPGVPPDATSAAEYAAFCVALGSVPGVVICTA